MGKRLLWFLFPIALVQSDMTKKGPVTKTRSGEDNVSMCVIYESGYEGIGLHIKTPNGIKHKDWFSAEECFPEGDKMQVYVWITEGGGGLNLVYKIGLCTKTCPISNVRQDTEQKTKEKKNQKERKLTVKAYSVSNWNKTIHLENCTLSPEPLPDSLKSITCNDEDDMNQLKLILCILGSVATEVVVMIALVVICHRKAQRKYPQSSSSEDIERECETNVTHNDLYEPVNNNTATDQEAPHGKENHMYESVDDILATCNGTPYNITNVTHNDLYEPVHKYTAADQEAPHGKENHLYESVDNIPAICKDAPYSIVNEKYIDLHKPGDNYIAAEQDSPYTDVENHVYESVDNILNTSDDTPYSNADTHNDLNKPAEIYTGTRQDPPYTNIENHVYESVDNILNTSNDSLCSIIDTHKDLNKPGENYTRQEPPYTNVENHVYESVDNILNTSNDSLCSIIDTHNDLNKPGENNTITE